MDNIMPHSPKKRWHWFTILLWAYSVIILFLASVLYLGIALRGPYTFASSEPVSPIENIIFAVVLLPILIFLIISARSNFKDN